MSIPILWAAISAASVLGVTLGWDLRWRGARGGTMALAAVFAIACAVDAIDAWRAEKSQDAPLFSCGAALLAVAAITYLLIGKSPGRREPESNLFD